MFADRAELIFLEGKTAVRVGDLTCISRCERFTKASSRFHDVEVVLYHDRGRVAHQRDLTGVLHHLHAVGAERVSQSVAFVFAPSCLARALQRLAEVAVEDRAGVVETKVRRPSASDRVFPVAIGRNLRIAKMDDV